jgi:RNase P subunit RPR2
VSRDGGKTWTREYVLDKYDTAMEEEMEMLRKEVNVFCEVCNKVMLVDDLKRHTHE